MNVIIPSNIWIFVLTLFLVSCGNSEIKNPLEEDPKEEEEEEEEGLNVSGIDLNNWKVTLPIGNPTEVEPPEILNFSTNPLLQDYMFNDTTDSSLVFFTEPGSSTTNSSYSRTELREQMVPGSNKTNWTFAQGGEMKGQLRVSRVSGETDNLDRVIVMQIHGRLTDEQRDLIGEDDNNAPPVLKIYWDDGKINVRRKILKDLDVSDLDILKKDAWTDDSHWFDTEVGYDSFQITINASAGRLQVELTGEDAIVFDDVHVEKWSVFENYFKAGNYLQTSESGSFSEVKYYSLEVHH